MEKIDFLTTLCNISTKLKETTEYCGVHCYPDNITVEEITNDGCVIVDENELHELFKVIAQTQVIVYDGIEEVAANFAKK